MRLTMLSRIIVLSLVMSATVIAADECEQATVDPGVIQSLTPVATRLNVQCPNQINVRNFCAAVAAQTGETRPVHDSIMYQYQTLVYNAACVEPQDSAEVVKAKIQHFWNRYHDSLLCDQINFSPRNGNILKLAVARRSESFIDDSLSNWAVNLNHVDTVDQQTVLDYIDQRKREAGSNQALVRSLQRYYDRFRSAGAKHKREL